MSPRHLRLACWWMMLAGAAGLFAQTAEENDETLGSASALRIEVESATPVLIEAGTRLRERPHPHAPVVTVVPVELPLEPLERNGDWARVRFGQRIGWAFLGIEEERFEPEVAVEVEPPEPVVSALAPDKERLEGALEQMTAAVEPLDAGPFRVFTDLDGRRKRELAFNATRQLPEAYRERYRLVPQREASFAVVIYDRESSYREFERTIGDLAALEAEGHAASGIAALVAEGRNSEEIAALLVHELAHLLNRQMFIATLPPWLEEGIANDLAYCQVDKQGQLNLGSLGGRSFVAEIPGARDRFGRRRFSGTFHIEGPIASLSLLQRALAEDEWVPIEELLDLTWREFVEPDGRKLRYIQSAFLVRYLLDELDGDRFRAYLRSFQEGGTADAAALFTALGASPEEVANGFRRWVRDHTGRS